MQYITTWSVQVSDISLRLHPWRHARCIVCDTFNEDENNIGLVKVSKARQAGAAKNIAAHTGVRTKLATSKGENFTKVFEHLHVSIEKCSARHWTAPNESQLLATKQNGDTMREGHVHPEPFKFARMLCLEILVNGVELKAGYSNRARERCMTNQSNRRKYILG